MSFSVGRTHTNNLLWDQRGRIHVMGGFHEEQVEIIDPWYGKAGGITRPLNLYQVSANARFSVGQSKEGVHLFSLTSRLEEVKFFEGHQLV